nr:hypothetical protein [uncultured Rhodopila sp.]
MRADTYTNIQPILRHELTNTGETTLRYLVIEKKYELVPGAGQSAGKSSRTSTQEMSARVDGDSPAAPTSCRPPAFAGPATSV